MGRDAKQRTDTDSQGLEAPRAPGGAYPLCCSACCPACCDGFSLVLGSLLLALVAWHATMEAAFFHSAPPGEMVLVSVDADPARSVLPTRHRMHLHCEGQGSPAVVFMHGYSGQARDWTYVQPALAKLTRACSFDRSGNGAC